MHDRPLDFVTASFDEPTPAANTAAALSLIKQQSPLSAVGIELKSSFLSNRASSTALIDQCQTLRAQNLLDVLVLAANPYTNYIVKPLLSWAVTQGVVTIAHDIFRGHPKSPGLFLPPSVSRQRRLPTAVPAMEEAIEQFKKCLDSCVRMEKTYVEKVASLLLQLPSSAVAPEQRPPGPGAAQADLPRVHSGELPAPDPLPRGVGPHQRQPGEFLSLPAPPHGPSDRSQVREGHQRLREAQR
jgi:hypothetical protein